MAKKKTARAASQKRQPGTTSVRIRDEAHEQLVTIRKQYRFASLSDAIDILFDGWGKLDEHAKHEVMGRPLPVRK